MVSQLRRALVLALATVFLTAGVAFAGNGATVTHFAVSYRAFGDPALPMLDCTGNRIVQSGRNAFVKDTETCVTTYPDYWPVGVLYRIVPFTGGNWTDDIWFSDYEGLAVAVPPTNSVCVQPLSDNVGQCFRAAISGVMSVTYSASTGLYTLSTVAYYAP